MGSRLQRWIGIAAIAAVFGVSAPAASETVIQVSNTAELVSALSTVPNGGVVELLSGTYLSPSSGFSITNATREFTVRAANTQSAILDGQGIYPILKLEAASPLTAGWVSFEGLVFQNGFSDDDVLAGGVTVNAARASFADCVFDSNLSDPRPSEGGSGGGTGVIGGSFAVFNRCVWLDNTAVNYAGAILIGGESQAYIHESEFVGNRTDPPGHRPASSGGAVNVRAASAWITNTRFEGNVSGFAGGGLKVSAAFSDPAAYAVVANCTFVDNRAEADPGVNPPSPPAGGAIMVEARADVMIYNSRFLNNSAELGGGISTYRSLVHIFSSVFRGNEARSTSTERGRGGAIKASSNDTSGDGSVNYRSAELVIRDSFFQGRYNGVGATAQSGGCIYASGDTNRMYGQSGVTQMGSLDDNRAVVDIDNTAFVDCDVDEFVSGEGIYGGGISGSLVEVFATDSTFVDCDASGSNGRGGGVAFALETLATFDGCTFANNTGDEQGGGIRMTGSELQVNDCEFLFNEVSPGVSEAENQSYGAAIFNTPQVQDDIDASGLVQNSTFVSNIGISVYDDDRIDSFGVVNDVRYNNNTFFGTTFGNRVYRDKVASANGMTASQLNTLVVDRGNGNTTNKSPAANNDEVPSAPVLGSLRAMPPAIIDAVAPGDPASSTESFLVYAWAGGNATLDGSPVSGNRGFSSSDVGSHQLAVSGQNFSTSITQADLPEGSIEADPQFITPGELTRIDWGVADGSFIGSVLNWGLDTGGQESGFAIVMPPDTRTFELNLVTEEGGAWTSITVFVDEDQMEMLFADGFESGDTAAWSSST